MTALGWSISGNGCAIPPGFGVDTEELAAFGVDRPPLGWVCHPWGASPRRPAKAAEARKSKRMITEIRRTEGVDFFIGFLSSYILRQKQPRGGFEHGESVDFGCGSVKPLCGTLID